MITINIIIFIVLIFFQAFFSGIEIGFVSLYKIQILYRALQGDKKAKILLSFYKKPHYFFSTILVGINIVSVAIATLFSVLLSKLGVKNYEVYAPFILLPFITIFGEALPKLIFQKYAKKLTFKGAYILRIVYIILFPIVYLFSLITILFSKIFRISKNIQDLEKKELYVISNEIIQKMGGEGFIIKKEIFIKYMQMPIKKLYGERNIPKLHPNMNIDEVIGILKNNNIYASYIQRDNNFYGIRLNKLLFARNIEDIKEPIILINENEMVYKLFFTLFRSENNMVLIVNKKNKVVNLLSKDEISEIFIKKLKK